MCRLLPHCTHTLSEGVQSNHWAFLPHCVVFYCAINHSRAVLLDWTQQSVAWLNMFLIKLLPSYVFYSDMRHPFFMSVLPHKDKIPFAILRWLAICTLMYYNLKSLTYIQINLLSSTAVWSHACTFTGIFWEQQAVVSTFWLRTNPNSLLILLFGPPPNRISYPISLAAWGVVVI